MDDKTKALIEELRNPKNDFPSYLKELCGRAADAIDPDFEAEIPSAPKVFAKRNCTNCRYLKWESGDVNDPEGYVCNGRGGYRTPKEESDHLNKLQCEPYREKSKSCHEHPDSMESPAYGCY